MSSRLIKTAKRLGLLALAYVLVLAGTYAYCELAEPPGIRVDQAAKPLLSPAERAALHPDTRAGLEAYEAGDYARAHALWLPRAEAGDAEAHLGIGRMFSHGKGVVQDRVAARNSYQSAASMGHPWGQFNLAYYLEAGLGGPKNIELALVLYGNAAEAGVAHSAFNLSLNYRHGTGVNKDLVQEIYWASKAAEKCHPGSLYRIAIAFMDGEVLQKTESHAYTILELSRLNGYKPANLAGVFHLFLLLPWDYIESRKIAWDRQNSTCAQAKILTLDP